MARSTRKSRSEIAPQSSLPEMEEAVRRFLRAAGFDPSKHPDLSETPTLVARAWRDELLSGYATSPARVLAPLLPAGTARGELVVLSRLTYQGVCPHHLIPYGGVAHLCYVPGRWLAGFGQLVRLLDCLSRRLALQEALARQLAEAMEEHLGAQGAGVVLEAEQGCVTLRGGRRPGSRATVEAFVGTMERSVELRERFRAAIARGETCGSIRR